MTPGQLFAAPGLVGRLGEAEDGADAVRQVASLLTAAGAAELALADAAAAQTLVAAPAAHPYVLVAGPLPGVRTPAAALAVFRLPVPVPSAPTASTLDVRTFAVIGTAAHAPRVVRAVRDTLEDGELAEILMDVPASEAHALVSEAVDFYADHGPVHSQAGTGSSVPATGRRVREIWRLLETGDNYLKYSPPADRQRAEDRARKRWEQALSDAKAISHIRLQRLAQRRLAGDRPDPVL